MQPGTLQPFKKMLRLLLPAALVMALLSTYAPIFAQQASKDSVYTITDSTRYNNDTTTIDNGDDVIRTFRDFNMPPEMLAHFGAVTPKDALTLREEFQVTQKDENDVAILITVKLHFDSDCLMGYIIEAPIDKTSDMTESNFTVKIPIEWICTPPTADHPEHYVSTLAAIKSAENQFKCTGWHIKLPDTDRPELKKKKGKKDKKSKKSKKPTKAAPPPAAAATPAPPQ